MIRFLFFQEGRDKRFLMNRLIGAADMKKTNVISQN